jgi:hypothetical protein
MKTLTNVSELTKEAIGDLYFQSLGNIQTRKMHVRLQENRGGPTPVAPSVHDIELDVPSWYAGILSIASGLDPGVDLPPVKEVVGYITANFERAKAAIAA